MTKDEAGRSAILAIERPHPNLLKLYLVRSFLVPPVSLLALPYLYFRYHTMRYRFDAEGVSMRWGILFRREVSLSYARIQDIHLTSGILQRWLRLADVHIQTASGSSEAEMKIEGLLEFESVRDFLYDKMRGIALLSPSGGTRKGRGRPGAEPAAASAGLSAAGPPEAESELAGALRGVTEELRAARLALERLADTRGGKGDV